MTDARSDRKELARRSASLLKTRLLQSERDTFAAAADAFAENQAFERAGAVIARSRRRFVLGTGSAEGYATAFTISLKTAFSQVHQVSPPALEHLELLTDVRTGDVLIAICTRPYRRDTVEMCKPYVAAGGTLVLLTDSPDSPLSAFAIEQIIIPTGNEDLGENALSVFLALRLISQLASASSKGAVRRAQERERFGELLNLHTADMRWTGKAGEPAQG